MTATKEDVPINRILAWFSLATILVGIFTWIFQAQATAQRADLNAAAALVKLENKADKQETQEQLKRIYDKLDSIDNYLRDMKK